mgnify:CR=1 FL=1
MGADERAIVMVNNPPGYYVAAERPAVVVPYGDLQVVMQAASRYGARYLILEDNYSTGKLAGIYQNPETAPGLIYLGAMDTTRLFEFAGTEE